MLLVCYINNRTFAEVYGYYIIGVLKTAKDVRTSNCRGDWQCLICLMCLKAEGEESLFYLENGGAGDKIQI